VIVVWVEVTTLWDIETEWSTVVISSEQVVWVVDVTWLMGSGLGELWWPHSLVGRLSLMDSHVWWPDSVRDLSLAIVPLLEEVRSILLVTWVDLWKIDHFLSELSLLETLVDEEIILLMHGSVASLAGSREDLESSSQSGRVPGVPMDIRWEVIVSVVHTDRVDLLFVTLDAVRGTNVVSKDPGF